jgi:type II transmembrane protein, putative
MILSDYTFCFVSSLTVDCFDSSCGGHGTCLNGICFCVKGWKGADCKELDSDALNCLPECSGHGTFNSESDQCICEDKWTGIDCSQGNL